MNPEERRQFVREHRTAVLGYPRKQHGPAMSIVYYVVEADEILVSTMAARAKAKAIARSPRITMCVLDEAWPPTYMQVYCEATIDTNREFVVDVMMRIAGVMAGTPMPEDVRPMVEEGARKEDRVVIRLRPYATFYTPPVHVHSSDDINESLKHTTSRSLPWDPDRAGAA